MGEPVSVLAARQGPGDAAAMPRRPATSREARTCPAPTAAGPRARPLVHSCPASLCHGKASGTCVFVSCAPAAGPGQARGSMCAGQNWPPRALRGSGWCHTLSPSLSYLLATYRQGPGHRTLHCHCLLQLCCKTQGRVGRTRAREAGEGRSVQSMRGGAGGGGCEDGQQEGGLGAQAGLLEAGRSAGKAVSPDAHTGRVPSGGGEEHKEQASRVPHTPCAPTRSSPWTQRT